LQVHGTPTARAAFSMTARYCAAACSINLACSSVITPPQIIAATPNSAATAPSMTLVITATIVIAKIASAIHAIAFIRTLLARADDADDKRGAGTWTCVRSAAPHATQPAARC
jgi:hypothetical protein